MPRGFVLSTSVCILLLGCEGISIESNYDTSIVGYVSEVACLDFRGTNFRMNDGRNPPISVGSAKRVALRCGMQREAHLGP